MKVVIKKDGSKELFNKEKIRLSIRKASLSAGIKFEDKKDQFEEIIKNVIKISKEEEELRTHNIRERVLNDLDKVESKVSDAWRNFDDKIKSR